MKASTALKPAMLFAAGSFVSASGAQAATTIDTTSYTATPGGTPITIGGASSPQYTFTAEAKTPPAVGYDFYLSGNDGSTVGQISYDHPHFLSSTDPQNGSVKTGYSSRTDVSDRYFGLRFKIGDDQYTGFAGVNSSGDTINEIGYRLASVPEPATWVLMIAGFGGLGVAMRRRRAQTLAAAVA